MLRALLVSYSFPPVGGAGVQRVAKLVKYLPEHGVVPSVLTVSNPSVPVRDETLLAELPPSLRVLRAPTLEPGYAVKGAAWTAQAGGQGGLRGQLARAARGLLLPDAQLLWQPGAAATLVRELLRRPGPEVVLISAPPFSQFLLAPLVRLARRAVVLDYRDEWSTCSSYEMGASGLGALLGPALEETLLRCAHVVTTATPEFRQALLGRFRFLRPEQVLTVPNGYDPDDFPQERPAPPTDRLVLGYAGTVFRLTSPRGLLGAIRRLAAREPALVRHLEVRFMGRIVQTERDAFAGMEALGVRQLGYLDHRRVLQELSRCHLCLCLLDEVPGAERIYPGKIFELMYLGRPVLTLAPEGALARLCRAHHLGPVLPPRDEEAIASYLAAQLRAFVAGTPPPAPAPVGIHRYHRRAVAGEAARAMRLAVAAAQRAPDRIAPAVNLPGDFADRPGPLAGRS
ncbi:MAG: hypothetical protein RMK29_15630 [Myxococcales bacterium]|nr:hypothetical protein [Myxococcota bacterium]MDW8283146.1 hypothetical protein [Myxococcales bacterium]